ncbi:acyltransferase [Pusillimonas sp.]|uniref:acyltransferase n=1 Tax=Pusillimonas sp. TaxID=3040095 RepID=UPI0037CAAA5F
MSAQFTAAEQADYDKLDAARWMAALAVVLLHCAAFPLTSVSEYGTSDWQWANLYDAASRWCVPVFVMISGALLLNPEKREAFKHFYQKRAARIAPAIVFWTAFYLLWGGLMYRLDGVPMDAAAWLRKATGGEPYYHLWYLYMLVGLYLFAPYLRALYARCSHRQQLAAVVGIFVLAMLQTVHRELNAGGYGFFLTWFLPYISYFVAGRMMFEGRLRLPRPGLILVLAIGVTAAGASAMSTADALNVYFYDTFSLTVPLMSLAVFQLILNARKLPRMTAIAPLTFGVYLAHPIFLDIAKRSGVYAPTTGTAWQTPLAATAIFVLSMGFVRVLRRLPGGTRIT